MRLAVISSRAVSLMNVARDIAYVAKKRGVTPILLDYAVNPYDLHRMANHAIIVMAANPLMGRSWFLLSRDMNKIGITSYVYTTVEGRLPRIFVKDWMRREVVFIANSRYTRERLEEVGLTVLDTVPHGVNHDDLRQAMAYRRMARRKIEEKLGKGVVFGIVASGHPRKGLDRFVDVVRLVTEASDDARFYIISTPGTIGFYAQEKHVFVDTSFGKRSRTETLGYIAAFDFLVHPALAEGFGLPVLEAMALGVPVIHIAYEPLTEFSDPDANIWVPYSSIVYDSFGEGIEYELHLYEPKEMAEAILQAVDIARSKREEYEERKAKAMEKAREYDVMKHYPKLLESFIEVEKITS